ncbi:MAG: hypothetical protein B7Z45_01625, partial [Azorhizobium sp. 12-66-6]
MVRFKALDAWRGICALLVVLFHFCFVFRSPLMGAPIVTNAFLFVDFFFVLSGFVVCHAYRDRLGDAPSWRAFVVRRFGRLWPLHASMLALFIAFIAMVNLLPHPERFAFTLGPSEYSAIAIPIHLLLLNAVDLHGMAWNAPSWSIGAEFYTYLLFGAVCVLALRRLQHPTYAALGWGRRDIEDLLFLGVIGIIVGGRLGYALFYRPLEFLAEPLRIFAVWEGGLSFHGGFIGVFAAIGLWAWGSMQLNKLAKETKLMLVEPVTSEFGMAYQLTPAQPAEINSFRSLGLVPSWDRSKYEDRITGQRNDTPFEFFEAHLEEKRTTTDGKGRTRTTWVTVFRGQCLVVNFHKKFNGVTKVFRDKGMFNIFGKLAQMGKSEKVRLEDPVFEKAFEVYSTDQIE